MSNFSEAQNLEKSLKSSQSLKDESEEKPNFDLSDIPNRLIDKKWKNRKRAYEIIEEKIENGEKSEKEFINEIVENNLSEIINEKNLATKNSALYALKKYFNYFDLKKNVGLPIMNNLLQISIKKFQDLINEIFIIIYRKDFFFVIDFIINKSFSKNNNKVKKILEILFYILEKENLENGIIKKLIFKLRHLLNNSNYNVKILAQKNYQILFSYVKDDFKSLEKSLFDNMRISQLKSLKNSMMNLKKKNSSFYLLENINYITNSNLQDLEKFEKKENHIFLDNLLPDKFLEIPYLTKINEKKNLLEKFFENLKKEKKKINLKVLSLNPILSILITELENSNFLLYKVTVEILLILTKEKIQKNLITNGIIKQIIIAISLKYNTKESFNLMINDLLKNLVFNNFIEIEKFCRFVIHEIKFSGHFNVKVFFLKWIEENLEKMIFFDFSIGKNSLKKNKSSKKILEFKKKNNLANLEVRENQREYPLIVKFFLDEISLLEKNEKKIKMKNLFKKSLKNIKKIFDNKDFDLKNNFIGEKNEIDFIFKDFENMSQENFGKNCEEILVNILIIFEKEKHLEEIEKIKILKILKKASGFENENNLENFLKILSYYDFKENENKIKNIFENLFTNNKLDILLEEILEIFEKKKNDLKLILQIFEIYIKQEENIKIDDLQNLYFLIKKNEKKNTNLKNILLKIAQKIDTKENSKNTNLNSIIEKKLSKEKKKKNPEEKFLKIFSQIKSEKDLIEFTDIISNNIRLLQSIQKKIEFEKISSKIESIILSILKKNIDFSNKFSEFLVLILSILTKDSKEKLFVLFLTLISKIQKTPSILFFPFFSQITNIFKNFKIAYKIVLTNFPENEKDFFIRNSLPHFLSKFEDDEFSIFSNDFIILIPGIIHGLVIEELSGICSNILEFIFNSFEIKDIVEKFEPELIVSKVLYDRFCSILENFKGESINGEEDVIDENTGDFGNYCPEEPLDSEINCNNFDNDNNPGNFDNGNNQDNFVNQNNQGNSNIENNEENFVDQNKEDFNNQNIQENLKNMIINKDDFENQNHSGKEVKVNNFLNEENLKNKVNKNNFKNEEDFENMENHHNIENEGYENTNLVNYSEINQNSNNLQNFENDIIENNNLQNERNPENIYDYENYYKNENCKNSLEEDHSLIKEKRGNFNKDQNSELIKIDEYKKSLEEKIPNSKKNYNLKNLKERRREKKLRKQNNKSIEKNYKSQNFDNLDNFTDQMISKEINNFSTFNFEINKEKLKLEKEKKNHQKTLSQLLELNKQNEELKFEIINLKKDLKNTIVVKKNPKNLYEKKINENIIKDIDKNFLSLICSRKLEETFFEKIIEEFEKKENYQKEKYIFDLKFTLCDTNKNIFKYIKKENYKNLLKTIINLIVKENSKENNINITTLLQIILDKALKIKKIDQILISLINIIKEKLPNFKTKFENFHQIVINLSLKCFEKVLEIFEDLKKENLSDNKNFENNFSFSSFEILISFYELFDVHKPESLNDECEYLEQFDEIFRILRCFSDKIVIFDIEGSKDFIQVFENNEEGIFIKYMKKYLKVILNNENK